MNINRPALLALTVFPLLASCQADNAGIESASAFGEANKQTFAAQVVDPDPQYEFLDPETSGEHAAQAVDRYRKGTVKQPERVRSTSGGSGKGGGSGGGGGN